MKYLVTFINAAGKQETKTIKAFDVKDATLRVRRWARFCSSPKITIVSVRRTP